jgi:hypothetical protein
MEEERISEIKKEERKQVKRNFSVYTVAWQLKGPNNGARRNCPLIGNGSINTIAATNTHATIEELF